MDLSKLRSSKNVEDLRNDPPLKTWKKRLSKITKTDEQEIDRSMVLDETAVRPAAQRAQKSRLDKLFPK